MLTNGRKSAVRRAACGAPQRARLAPLLFVLCLNDFEGCLQLFRARIYADDTHETVVSNDIEELIQTTKEDLKNIPDWMTAQKLSANPKKQNLWY